MKPRKPPLPGWAQSIHSALPEEGSAKVLIPGAEGVRYVELSRRELEESADQVTARRERRRRRARKVLEHHRTRRAMAAVGVLAVVLVLVFGNVGLFQQSRSAAFELEDRETEIQTLDGALRAYLDVTRHLLKDENVNMLASMESVGLDPEALYEDARIASAMGSGDEGDGGSPLLRSLLERMDDEQEGLLVENMRLNGLASLLPTHTPLSEKRRVSGFGLRGHPISGRLQHHAGVDFVTSGDPTITASQPGVVTLAQWNGAYGLSVEITGVTGIVTRYAHLRSIAVEVGEEVQPGDPIGVMGSTGVSTGPHLHYEVLVDGEQVDPMPMLELSGHGMD